MTDKQRLALVTGGSRGIGRAACLALAADGIGVIVHYHRAKQRADEVLAESGVKAALQADLADPESTAAMFAAVAEQFGGIDILVNNAGEMTDAPVEAMTDAEWEEALALNLTAVFRCTRACIPHMKQQQWGRIINLSSQVTETGSRNHAHYAAAKSGVLGFTYSLAKELGAFGITVNAVSPGRIKTDMLAEHIAGREQEWLSQTPLRRLGRPEEVAAGIAFLASDAASYITGANLPINGGLVMG